MCPSLNRYTYDHFNDIAIKQNEGNAYHPIDCFCIVVQQ